MERIKSSRPANQINVSGNIIRTGVGGNDRQRGNYVYVLEVNLTVR